MTLTQLEYIQALAKYGNYSRAARSLGISQPALSLQIKKLEELIGFQIIIRSKKKQSLTEKGQVFLNRSTLLLNEKKQLDSLVAKLRDDDSGIIRIGIIPTLAPYLLPMFINEMNKLHPQIKLHVTEMLTEEIMDHITTGDLDGGIIATPITSHIDLNIEPLFYEQFLLFVSQNHKLFNQKKVDIKDIPVNDIHLLKEGNCFRDQVNNICGIVQNVNMTSSFHFESNSIESLCRIVEFKGGVTFLPELTTMHISNDREDMIKELKGTKKVREISIIHLPNHIYKSKMATLSSVIKSSLPKHLLKKGKGESISIKPDNTK